MLIPNKFNGYHNGTRQLHFGSGGGGGGGQTTSTVQNTNIPEYARPYVETMLGATQEQLFQGNRTPITTDPVTGETTGGDFNITGFKPYQAYGGTYDPKTGEQLSYDPSKGIAKINDAQQQAYMGMYGMRQDPNFANAAQRANQASLDAIRTASISADYGQAGQRSGLKGQQLGIAGGQKYGEMGAGYGTQGANLGIAGGQKYGEMGAGYGAQGAGYGSQAAGLADTALGYGSTGAGYGAQAAQLANTALGYGRRASTIGEMALDAQDTGNEIGTLARGYAGQAAGAGQQYAKQATDPNAMKAYMSPYMQNVVDVQNEEARRQSRIAGTQQQAEAAKAGAFGGGRDAIMRAERERNLATIMNQNTAQGQQAAFQQAQQAQQFGAGLGLQGLQGAQQGLGTALQGGQLGLSGLGTALQGQQGALSGVGQAGSMYGLGMQGSQVGLGGVGAANQAYQTGIQGSQAGIAGAGMGLQGVNAQLAGTAQGMQGAQIGLQGVDRQLAGTAQGMQGAQVGLQGMQAAQAGFGLSNQAAANMANIANQGQAAQQALYNNQMAMGDKRMAYDQSILNQAVQDYANAQQYPLMQLGTMSNMLRGLPMQASTTNQYAAAPTAASQAIGTIGSGASIYNAMKPGPGGAAGGLPSEFKYAKGGITSVPRYDMGGEVESQLESMDEKGLQAQARESSSPTIRKMAQRMLRERQMSKQPQSPDAANVQYQAAGVPSYKPGGIVAFTTGGGANEEGGEEEAKLDMEKRLAMPPSTTPPPGGIMGATVQPTTQVPVAPPKPLPDIAQEAMRQRDIYSAQATRPTAELLKEIQAEREALGVGDNKAREELRSQQMAERANMKDEQQRQKHLRLAEFFASWGSTPGPTLVAGMNALKQSIPGIVSDEKEAKKARKEADKIIYDIDEATRLEKLGMIDKATALKQKAASHAEDYNKYLLSLQGQREGNEKSLEVARIQAKAQTDSAAMRNASDKLGRLQAEALRNEDRIFLRYQAATKEYNDVLSDVAKQESQDAHKNDLKNLTTYTMGAVNKKTGEIDVNKISPSYKAAYAETLKRVNERKEGWNTAIEDAKKEKNLAFSRIKNLSPEAVEARTGPKVNPADSGAGTTGNFPTPTAKHIQALKDNPGAKAEFDGKFGPGAADEYLGK